MRANFPMVGAEIDRDNNRECFCETQQVAPLVCVPIGANSSPAV
jgi:hypothetical protein